MKDEFKLIRVKHRIDFWYNKEFYFYEKFVKETDDKENPIIEFVIYKDQGRIMGPGDYSTPEGVFIYNIIKDEMGLDFF